MSKAGWIRLVVLAAFFGAVEAMCRTGVISPKLVIAPTAMVEAMVKLLGSGELNPDIRQTLSSVGIAMGLSVTGGFALGCVLYWLPPLHRIEISNPKKGMDKYVYTYSDDELQRKLAELAKKGMSWKDPVQRYKGLGEMDADQLAETTMDPRRRTLRKLTVDDADEAAKVFELLMGSDVAPRKEFLVQGAYEIDATTLDA